MFNFELKNPTQTKKDIVSKHGSMLQFSFKIGMSYSVVYRIMNGNKAKKFNADKISKALHKNTSDIFLVK